MKGAPSRLAQVSAPVTGETPFGGRTTGWMPVCPVWLSVMSTRNWEDKDAGQRPREGARIEATARFDARLARGQRVSLDGADWNLVHVVADAPTMGRMTLTLEREAA